MRRLTEEQKRRAESHPACRIPYALARRAAGRDESGHEDLLSCALLGYVQCAATFDPRRHPHGEGGWPRYAAYWTRLLMWRHLEAERRGIPPEHALIADQLPARPAGAACPAEAADFWRLAMLHVGHGKPRRLLAAWCRGEELASLARANGDTAQAAGQMVRYWLRKVGERMAVPS